MKLTTNCRFLPLAVLLGSLSSQLGLSTTFSLNPSADAFVTTGPSATLANNNYGGAGALSVAAPGLAQGEFQTVLQFGLSGAKSSFDSQFGAGQWTIQSVSLQLTTSGQSNPIFNNRAAGMLDISWMQNDGWMEGNGTPQAPTTTGITFSTLSNFVSGADELLGAFSYNGATIGNVTYALNLTPSFSADVLAGNTTSFRLFAVDSVISYLSQSRDFGTASARPSLIINAVAVPEPSALALGLLGAGLFVRIRRHLSPRGA